MHYKQKRDTDNSVSRFCTSQIRICKKKKGCHHDNPTFINLKSNTMKNTVQIYSTFLCCTTYFPVFLRFLNYFNDNNGVQSTIQAKIKEKVW